MHARHRYGKSQDMVLHDTRTTGNTWISALQTYGYTSMFHEYTDNISYYCYDQDTEVLYGLLLHIYVS